MKTRAIQLIDSYGGAACYAVEVLRDGRWQLATFDTTDAALVIGIAQAIAENGEDGWERSVLGEYGTPGPDAWNDHRNFVRLLEQKGAVFNGSSDDGPGIQDAYDAFTNDTRGAILFPPSSPIKLLTPITFKAGLAAVNFNGSLLDASTPMSGRAFNLIPNPVAPYSQWCPAQPIEKFILKGPLGTTLNPTELAAFNSDGLGIGARPGDAGELSKFALRDFLIMGFRDALSFLDQCWLISLHNAFVSSACRFNIDMQAVVNAGECMSWHGGASFNAKNVNGDALGLRMATLDNGDNELVMHGIGFDYNDISMDIEGGVVTGNGCHFENRGPAAAIKIVGNAADTPSGLNLYGGAVVDRYLDGGGIESGRDHLIEISGDKAFANLQTAFPLYDRNTEIIRILSGNPRVDVSRSQFDLSGLTRFASIGRELNQLANGDFGLGTLAAWVTGGTGFVYAADATVKPPGAAYSAKMTGPGTAANGNIKQTLRCRPGQQVIVRGSVFAQTLTAGSVYLRLSFYNEDLSVLKLKYDLLALSGATGDFVPVRAQRNAPQGAQRVMVDMYGFGFGGVAFLGGCDLQVW